ncbi:MAG: hypothetical protein CEE43_01090 [Promethearchaeota archaeon Loki_b32]|nr:MAG: hypothetical protein CEE43_01090 [Candidatus Lokiarchaeota archaeon Loki_b32]
MTSRKNEEGDSRPINLVLLAVSFIIFGVLGIVFITQMDLHPGWAWEDIRDVYPTQIYAFSTEDIDGNGVNEIIAYADIGGTDRPDRYPDFQYGGIYCLEGSSGTPLWIREYNGPVKKVFPIMDVDGDGVKDYFMSKGSVGTNWTRQNSHYEPEIIPNMYTNQLISGSNGTDLSILIGDGISFTNFYIHDLISLYDLPDLQEDLIVLEGEEYESPYEEETFWMYNFSISTYFINGTKSISINNTYKGHLNPDSKTPALELFEYTDQSHLLYFSYFTVFLYNLSSNGLLDQIYNITSAQQIQEYELIDDLTDDDISEILVITWDGNLTLYDGYDGGILLEFNIPPGVSDINLEEILSPEKDGICYFLLTARYWHSDDFDEIIMQVYKIEDLSEEVIWEVIKTGDDIEDRVYVLNEDIDGDSIGELIYNKVFVPFVSINEVRRYTILNFINGNELAILNTDVGSEGIITISDFDGDGKKDFAIFGDDRVVALSASKPRGLWLSSAFPLGLPLFIVLATLLVAGVIIIVLRGKRLKYRRQAVKEHKLTVAVNILAIALMTLTFLLFLILMNIFNNTLITGSNNTNIVIAFLIVTIIWYGTLPLTAALYNRFAPQFAYIFVKLRNLFFKFSKGYKNDILVLDMRGKDEIGLVNQLKRLVLPLLLSISVGFYAYDVLTSFFGYPVTFDVFGSTEFFGFMMGYMLCCVLPMILSFILFSFFISGNYLLDDAGIVYYRENKKYRQPGDIEPISIWAQSIVKGIAGLSALLTFGTFLGTVDFAGFFGEGDALMFMFGILIVVVMFGGIPFLTAFSYILFAGEVMELNAEENIQKLYNIMEKNGYDTKPRDITNIYPSGYKVSERETPKDTENPDTSLLE